MLNFFIGFAFFEFGALCGFFVAALMQAARDDSERWSDSTPAVSVKITSR